MQNLLAKIHTRKISIDHVIIPVPELEEQCFRTTPGEKKMSFLLRGFLFNTDSKQFNNGFNLDPIIDNKNNKNFSLLKLDTFDKYEQEKQTEDLNTELDAIRFQNNNKQLTVL